MDQHQLSVTNRLAWNNGAYEAWVKDYGEPSAAAKNIQADPHYTARRILPHLGDPAGLEIANPLGSHGRVATALSLLGGNVSVFDISKSNAKYGQELAQAAGVKLEYVVGNFVEQAGMCSKLFDATVMELGILHYFASLDVFVDAVKRITKPLGTIVLVDFHPLLRKAIATSSDKLTLKGDYFSCELEIAATPFQPILEREIPSCLIRRWSMAEIVNAFLGPELSLTYFAEHRDEECEYLPGTFTLVANRCA